MRVSMTYNLFNRISLTFGSICLLTLLVIVIPSWLDEQHYLGAFINGTALLVILVLIIISLFRYRLTVTDEYAERREIFTKRIYFKNLKSIKIDGLNVLLTSHDCAIGFGGGIEKRQEFFDALMKQIVGLDGVTKSGDKETLEKYFGHIGKKLS